MSFARWLRHFQKAIATLLIFAFFCSVGGHWLILQGVAWGKMTVSFIQTEKDTISIALQKTFDGKHPCKLCKQIEKHRPISEKQDPKQFEIKQKDPLWIEVADRFLIPLERTKVLYSYPESSFSFSIKPPTPPPRIS